MVRLRLLAAVSLCMMTLAGCMGGGDGDGETTTSTSSTGEPATGRATAVTITSAPTSAPADAKATVCFAVSGTGRVSHVAIHWDNVTHAAEPGRTFQSYDLGMAFPDNRSSPDPNGYQLQTTGARFCTAATMPDSGSIFVVAHAMDTDSSPGDLSAEREIQVLPGQAMIEVEDNAYDPPALEVRAGETVSVHNLDAFAHTATADDGSFTTGDIPGGQTKTFSAPMAPGTYTYHCERHASMHGTLTVTAS